MGETSWVFLLVGSFAALGAAMAAGTLAAIVRYHRTGGMPGSDGPVELTAARLVSLWVRVAIGVVVAVVGVVMIQRAGIL